MIYLNPFKISPHCAHEKGSYVFMDPTGRKSWTGHLRGNQWTEGCKTTKTFRASSPTKVPGLRGRWQWNEMSPSEIRMESVPFLVCTNTLEREEIESHTRFLDFILDSTFRRFLYKKKNEHVINRRMKFRAIIAPCENRTGKRICPVMKGEELNSRRHVSLPDDMAVIDDVYLEITADYQVVRSKTNPSDVVMEVYMPRIRINRFPENLKTWSKHETE